MAGVGITAKIKPLNGNPAPGAAFPVFEDTDGQGGLRSVATIAERNSFSAAPIYCKPGMECYVDAVQCTYELAHDLTTWVLSKPSPALASQADWYVDSAGSVNNDGKAGNPIPFEELSRRLCLNCTRCMLTRDVVVHVALGSTFGYEFLAVGSADGGIHTLFIECAITSSAPFALTAVVQPDPSTKQRGELTTATGAFAHYQRVRLVTGASAGAVAYSTGLHAGAQNSYVSGFIVPTDGAFHVPTPAAVGDMAVTDTLSVQFGRLELDCGAGALLVVEDAQLVRAVVKGVTVNTPSAEGGGNVTFSGCAAVGTGSVWDCTAAGGANLFACLVVNTTSSPFGLRGSTTFTGDGWLGWGNVVQGRMGTGSGTFLSYGLCIDGGQLIVGVNAFFNPNSSGSPSRFAAYQGYDGAGAIEVENGPGLGIPAVWIAPGSVMQAGIPIAQQWSGAGTTPYDIGYEISAGAWLYVENLVPGMLVQWLTIASTVNIRCGGLDFDYSDNPIVIANSNCGITQADFAAAGSLTDGGFYKKNQNANIGATGFVNIITAGQYKVTGYLCTTTADAGSADVPVLNVTYVDDSGTSRTKAVVTGHALTTLGGEGGQVIIELNGSAQLQWSITGVSSPGAAKFSTRCRVEYVAFGP